MACCLNSPLWGEWVWDLGFKFFGHNFIKYQNYQTKIIFQFHYYFFNFWVDIYSKFFLSKILEKVKISFGRV